MTRAITEVDAKRSLTHGGLATLRQSGANFESILVAERLPESSETYLIEASFTWQGVSFRYPFKLERTETSGWTIRWHPVSTYSRDLLRLLKSGALPDLRRADGEATSWTTDTTVPAMPVLVTSNRVTTPMGRLALTSDQGLSAPKGFKRHMTRWVRRLSQSDEAGAALEMIASRDIAWHHVTRLLLAAAGFGYIRLYMIGRDEPSDELVRASYLAPVSFQSSSNERPPSLVVGLYRIAPEYRFRISLGDQLLSGDRSCESGSEETPMSLCLSKLESFPDALRGVIRTSKERPRVSRVMFASVGSLTLERILPVLRRLPGVLDIPAHQLMLGYIRAPSERGSNP